MFSNLENMSPKISPMTVCLYVQTNVAQELSAGRRRRMLSRPAARSGRSITQTACAEPMCMSVASLRPNSVQTQAADLVRRQAH